MSNNPIVDKHEALTFEDLMSSAPVRALEVEGLKKGGGKGLIYYRPFSAGSILAFAEAKRDAEKEDAGPRNVERVMNALVDAVCNADGSPFFTDESIRKLPTTVIMTLSNAITSDSNKRGADAGNA